MARNPDIYRKRRRQQMRTPYRPLAPSYKNTRQYEKAVKLRARSQYDPILNEINRAQGREDSASANRTGQIQGWQGQYQGTLDKAFSDTQGALNDLIALHGSADTATQDAMRAALGKSAEENAGLGATIGGAVAAPNAEEATAVPSSMNQLLTRLSMSGLQAAGERRQLAGLAGLRSIDEEGARHRAATTDIEGQRHDLMERIPEFLAQARSAINEEELNKQNLRFQQGLAGKEFGLKKKEFKLNKKNLKFQQWLARAGFNLDKFKAHDASALSWGQLALDHETLNMQRTKLASDIANGSNGVSEADAKRWQNGVAALTGWLEPGDGDRYPGKGDWADKHSKKAGQVNPKLYKQNHKPQDLFRTLTGQVRMSAGGALRLMLSANNNVVRKWAHTEFQRRKFRKGAHQGSATPRNLDGSPG